MRVHSVMCDRCKMTIRGESETLSLSPRLAKELKNKDNSHVADLCTPCSDSFVSFMNLDAGLRKASMNRLETNTPSACGNCGEQSPCEKRELASSSPPIFRGDWLWLCPTCIEKIGTQSKPFSEPA